MKTLSPIRPIKNNEDYYSYSESVLPKILIRMIFLITIILLFVELTQAQHTFNITGSGNNAIGLKNNIKVAAASKTGLVSSITLRKTDSVSVTSTPSAKVRHLDRIADSENKANAMINSYFQGVDDADSNYKAKRSGKGLIFATTLITGPVGGLIPAIACSANAPKNNLNIPNSPLVNDEAYMKGYKSEAHYIKKHNTWPCYVVASIVWLAAANFIMR